MKAGRVGALPVFWQTLLLLVTAVIVAQAIGIALLFWLPQPRPGFNRLSDVGAALSGQAVDAADDGRERRLLVGTRAAAPLPTRRMTADPALTQALAARLHVDASRIRLFFEPEVPRNRRHRNREPAWRRTEPLFFGALVAGVRRPGGWLVAETEPLPLVAPWQRRIMLWFAASALALVPFAWVFARAISRPIRRFADAADRLRTDPQAPAVPEEGPAELRVTARALNRMQARVAAHLAERTAMIGAIAHDLRTPLARIAFRVEAAPEPIRDKVMGDVDQMRAMVSAVIGFARNTGGTTDHDALDLAALLEAIVAQDRELGRAVTAGKIAPAVVNGDAVALERLFQNLVNNGLAYAGAVEVALSVGNARAVATVADRGPGLPADLIERVFQPFERGEPSRNRETGGIGLGLTIARAIAEEHGGTLTLRNRAGGGLEARVDLPVAA